MRGFVDRAQAGRELAGAMGELAGRDAVVLGIPRGGVIVAEAISAELGLPLDIVIPKKIGAPGNPELGLGAVAPGVSVVDEGLVERLGVPRAYLEREIARELEEIGRRERAYRGDRPAADLTGKTAVVVDDGIATGGTAVAALRWARSKSPTRVVLAVPVAPPSTVPTLRRESDEVVVLLTPEPFVAVGRWYRDFRQTGDAEVVAALENAARGPSAAPAEDRTGP